MKLSYRSEIDGLRTIAVLSVILYHAQIVVFGHDFFKGGFVGVDIFFVISGYLISRILLRELFEKDKISFLQFYERRARRILPILFTVFLVSFPLAYKYLLPNQFIEYAQSIMSATFFGSNIFFYFTNTQYGAEDSLLQPFLHTWSLGVEEQFYILFPIGLLLVYKFAKNSLVTIIAALILISLSYANWQSTKNTQLNFFMLTSRLWELGIGSLLAFYELKYGRVKHELLNQTMPLLGFAMIAYSIVFFKNQTPHPSFITLVPTLGTALIILYIENKTDMVSKVLCWKPIVNIGLISYSMYLWHNPIFAFPRIADANGLHNDEKYLLILLTIVLSIISYFLIEKPFRNKQFLNRKKFSVAILALLIAVLGINWMVIRTKGFEERLPKILTNEDFFQEPWNTLKVNDEICYGNLKCNKGDEKNQKIFFVGDSNMQNITNSFVKLYQNEFNIFSMNSSGCYFLTKNFKSWSNGSERKILNAPCDNNFQKNRIDIILKYPKSIVIIGGMLDVYLNDKNLSFKDEIEGKSIEDGVVDNINFLLKNNYKVIVLLPYPRSRINVSQFILNKSKKRNMINIQDNLISKIEKNDYLRVVSYSHKILTDIKHKNYYPINVENLFCDDGYCYFNDNNNLFLIDTFHPSEKMSDAISAKIYNLIKEIL